MTVKATRFSPETLISAPRRSNAVPNYDGSRALYSVSEYGFEEQKKAGEIRAAVVKTGGGSVIDTSGRASNPVWLSREEGEPRVLFLREREKEKGVVDLMCCDNLTADKGNEKPYCVGTFPGPVDNLKVIKLGSEYYGVAVTGRASPDGKLYNPHAAPKPKTTAKLYKSLFVRHWDTYITPERQSIFFAALMPHDDSSPNSRLFMTNINNPLKGTGLESPMPPFGGADHFDISKSGLVFVAKDPKLNPALHAKCNIYLIPLSSYLETTPTIYTVKLSEFSGAFTSPSFSPDGDKVAFLAMREDGYEADRNEILVMDDVTRPSWITHLRASALAKAKWDRSPASVDWDYTGESLWLIAENYGTKQIFNIPLDSSATSPPVLYPISGSASSIIPLLTGSIWATSSSVIDSSIWWLFDPSSTPTLTPGTPPAHDPGWSTSLRSSVDACLSAPIKPVLSYSQDGARFHLHPDQFHHATVGADNRNGYVHFFYMRPSDFDSSKSYPVAFIIHGGPQGSWENAWSTRWNPAVFAEQGYIVVMPNPTGSTGYGQGFTDAIQSNWGGTPYEDIVTVFDFLKTVPYMDLERAVLLGASYGGFMANWVQGHSLGRKLKAIVTHDGTFSTSYEMATDELYFVNHEFNGRWDPSNSKSRDEWARWDPSLHTNRWTTPHLVIHSEKDYRLTVAEGVAAFNALQQNGTPSEFLTFSDENHFVLERENSLIWHEAVLNWINRYVGLPSWERRRGDLDKVRMDPELSVRQSEVQTVETGGRIEGSFGGNFGKHEGEVC